MHITVSGKQVDVGDALKTHVENGLTAITSKYFDHALEARIVFGRARSFFTCDIDVHAGRGLKMRGEGEAATAHAAFDDAAEHIAKRLRRYRRRNRSSGELNVVYRRTDGHIGWIDTAAAAAR